MLLSLDFNDSRTDSGRRTADSTAERWAAPLRTDVLVIGGGLAGTALAYHLAGASIETTLIERFDLNTQASGSNSGSIHAQIPNEPFSVNGDGWTRSFAPTVRLMLASIALWKRVGEDLGVDLEVDTPGGLVAARSQAELDGLRRKLVFEAEQGLEGHLLDRAELRAIAPYVSETMVGGAFYPVEGKANPLVAAPAFARAAMARGALILTHTPLASLDALPHGGFRAETSRGAILASRVVDCAGAEAGTIAAMIGLDLPIEAYPIQTSVTEPTAPLIKHLLYGAREKLTLKQNRLGNLLIGGGWSARRDASGRPVADIRSLVQNMRLAVDMVPDLTSVDVVRTWAAVVNGTADWKPLLGEAPRVPGFFLCFFPWMGFTAGPVVARAIGDLVLGRAPEVDLGPFLISGR
jgi:glycine/D-amino acid oxidase-like deaminating enzyme